MITLQAIRNTGHTVLPVVVEQQIGQRQTPPIRVLDYRALGLILELVQTGLW